MTSRLIKETPGSTDAVNFMRYFRPTYCLISMQACNKSLFAFPLSSFCLPVILPWVVWVSGLTLLHSNQFTPHTATRAAVTDDQNWVRVWQNRTELRSSFWVPQSTLNTLSPVTRLISSFSRFSVVLPNVRRHAVLKNERFIKNLQMKWRSYAFSFVHQRRRIYLQTNHRIWLQLFVLYFLSLLRKCAFWIKIISQLSNTFSFKS